MKLIVGLGNPGEKYKNTRHNIGFWVVDKLIAKLKAQSAKPQLKTQNYSFAEVFIFKNVILAKPLVPMNASGVAVKKLTSRFKIQDSNIWLIHDDLDLLLGQIKIAKCRGAAGHRGIASVIKHLGTSDFIRFRLGIGRPKKKGKWWVSLGGLTSENVKHQEVIDFVLSEFESKERVEAEKMVKKAVEILQFALENGLEVAMNRYHQ